MRRSRTYILVSLMCLPDIAGAGAVYTENTQAQFTAGSHNSTYVSGSDPDAGVALDYYGRAGGFSAPGSDEWFDASWEYRQPYTLNSPNSATLSNYPVALTLDTAGPIAAGRMNADGSDIRFTTAAAAGAAASLPYYIESGINTASTKIWVKHASIAPGAGAIYLYSGNTSAAAASSMAGTFLLGDNFTAANGSVPSTTTWPNIQSAAPVSGSLRDIQSNRLRLLFGSPLNLRHYGLRSASQYPFAAGRRYRADINARTAGSDSWSSITLCQTIYNYSYDQDDWLRFSIKHSAGGATYAIERSDYGTKTTLASGSVSAGFHSVDFVMTASSFSVLLDDSQVYAAVNNLAFDSPYIYLEASSSASSLEEFLFDNISVRPYSLPEPSFGSPGAAQGRRYASGTFLSQVKDTGSAGTKYQAIDWAAVTPSSASVTFETRAHDTDILLGTFTAAAKGGDPAVSGRYVQYRLGLATLDPRYTAAVGSVTLAYTTPPLAPSGAAGLALSEASIHWSWTDNSSGQYQEDGFQVLNATGAVKGSVTSGTTYWIEAGLYPNILYSRQIAGYNTAGTGPATAVSKYTLAATPDIGCDKSTGTWLPGTLTCLNLAGFGDNGVAYYRYVWTQTPAYASWSGSEAQWTSGTLLYSAPSSGVYYLHVKSYNGDSLPTAGYRTFGPYWYDKNAPSITGFSPSSNPWTNAYVNPAVSLSDTGGSRLSRVRYRWTASSDRPATGYQAWDYTITGNDTVISNFTQATAGQWYLHVELEDIAGNPGYSYAGIYKIDLTKPTGSIVINSNDTYTPRREVTLSLTYADSESGVKNLAYKNLGYGWSATELPQATTAWVLSAGDGGKQVYLQVTDNAGNVQQYADTITLDSRTSLAGAAVNGTASGVMGEPAEAFNASATLAWTPTGELLAGKTLSFYFNGSTKTAVTDSLGAASQNFNVPTASGTYVYAISFPTDGVYAVSSATGTLTAAQRPASLITEDVNTTSGAGFTAKATLKDFQTESPITGATVTFVFEGATVTAVTSGEGVATAAFTAPLPVGIYNYSASYAGSPVYAPKSATGGVGVGLRVTTLVVPALAALAQSEFNAQATLYDGTATVSGMTISFVFQGSTRTAVTNASGVAVSSYTAPASSGTYPYTAAYAGDGTYAASSGGAGLTVNRRPLNLAGETALGYVNAAFQARATLYDGLTAARVEDKSIVFVFESSSAAVTTDGNGVAAAMFDSGSLPRGATCYYSFAGDSGYAFADSSATVTISRRPVALTASDTSAPLNSSFTATVELKDTAFTPAGIPDKTITFSFKGEIKTALTNAAGVATVSYQTGLSTGSYDFYATSDQDSVYLAGSDTGTVTMDKRATALTAYPWYGFAFDSIKPVAALKDSLSGAYISSATIIFNYNGVPQSTATGSGGATLGKAYAVYTGTGVAGSYSYYADFPGTSLYAASSGTGTLTVNLRSANLSAFPQTTLWGNPFTATAEIRDSVTSALLSGKTIKMVFQSSTVYTQTAGGSATTNFNAPSSTGTFNWLAEFAGDAAYAQASSTGTITVNRRTPTLTAIASSRYVWDSVFLSASFLDGSTPIASRNISFYFMGSTLTAATNGSGVATAGPFASISTPNAYGFTAQFAGDADYSAQSSSSTLTVTARLTNLNLGPISAISNATFTLTATLLDTNWSSGISGKPVSFTLEGATYAVTANTDGSGIARAVYTASSTTGGYIYSATFSGNTNYAGSSSSNTVTVTVRPTVLEMADYYPAAASTFTVTAVLRDYTTGVAIATKTVSFLFLSSTRTAATNALGSASTSYVALSSTQSYPLSASFAGDALYSSAYIAKTVYPGTRSTSLQTADVVNAVANATFTVTARLSDFTLGYSIAGATITFSFTGASTFTLTALTNSGGNAGVNFTAPASTGSYTYTAVFAGDALYTGNTNTSAVTVDRRTLTIEPSDLTSVPATSTFTATAVLKDGTVTLSTRTLNFTFVTSVATKTAVTNGIGVATTTFYAPSSTGNYTCVVYSTGDALYKPASASAGVAVTRRLVNLDLGAVSAIANSTFTLSAFLLDNDLGTPINGMAVSFLFQSVTSAAVTNASGKAVVVYTAPGSTGTYNYSATYNGNAVYAAASGTNTVTVTVRPAVLEMADYYPAAASTFTVSAVLKDYTTGVAIATKTVSFLFLGSTKTAVTSALGSASTTYVTLSSTVSYPITASFAGDALYSPAFISKIVYPARRGTTLQTSDVLTAVAKDTFTVTARLSDYSLGYYISGATITFSFSGASTFTLTAVTNSTGTASRNFTAPASTGNYTYTAVFGGDALYSGASSTSTVAVDRRTLTINPSDLTSVAASSTFTATAVLKDGAVTLSTKTLNFTFVTSVATKTAVTNGIGVATTTFYAPSSSGTFSYVAYSTGDALYKPASASAGVGVVLRPTVLEVPDVADAVVNYKFTGTAKLRDIELGNALVLSTKTIRIVFGTTTVNAITDVGVATAAFTAPSSTGAYQYTATFFGDSVYGYSQSTGTVTVNRRPVLFGLATQPSQPYTYRPNAVQSSFTVTATLQDGQVAGLFLENRTIRFVFQGVEKTAVTDSVGVASVTYASLSSSGTYAYYGYFDGDVSYNPNVPEDSTKSVTLIPRPTYINPYVGNGDLLDTSWIATFHTYSPRGYINDGLSFEGVQGLTASFAVQGATITGVSNAAGLAVSSAAFPWIQYAGVYPATVTFSGNATYASSILHGGPDLGQPSQGKVVIDLTPARVALTDIQEVYPDEDVVVSGTAYDYWGRAWARERLIGKQVWYKLSSTPCFMDACAEARTWGSPVYANINGSYAATATVHTPLTAGDYPIDVWFNTDASFYQYRVTENQRILRVGRRLTYIIPDSEPVYVGAMMPIDITVKLADATQSFAGINGKNLDVVLVTTQTLVTASIPEAGKAKATFSGLAVGTYTYTARFNDGDGTYMPYTSTGTVVVSKNTTILTADDIAHVPAGNSFTARALLQVIVGTSTQYLAGQTVNFVFTSTSGPTIDLSAVTNSVGVATVTYWSPYVPANYNYTATLPEDAVNKGSSDVSNSVEVVKRATLVTAVPASVYINENFVSTATLTDSDLGGSTVPAKNISFIFHRSPDVNLSAVTDSLGVATVTYASPASSGTYNYSATFPGDALYALDSDTKTVTVSRRVTELTAVDLTTPTNSALTLNATLADITFNLGVSTPIAGVQVKFVFDGVTRYAGTDAYGVASATFTAPAIAATYPYSATFEGTQTYNISATGTKNVTVRKTNTIVSGSDVLVPAGTQFAAGALLIDEFGVKLKGYTLNFVFTGTTAYNGSGVTDINGEATALFTSPLSTGTYNFTAGFAGDATYEADSDTVNNVVVNAASTTLSVPDGVVTVNDVYYATATLKGKASGEGVSDKLISFTYRGSGLGQSLTDASGIALKTFTPDSTGVFELDADWAGDTAFYASAGSATITVNRRLSGITAPDANTEAGFLFIATATLSDLGIAPSTWIAGRTVEFFFEGVSSSAVTNSLGVATVAYTAPGIGGVSYPITATFNGDPIYGSTATSAIVNVAKHITALTVASGSVTALEVFNATATLKWGAAPVQGKIIQFTYKGSVFDGPATDADGRSFLQFDAGASSGPWRLDAAFNDSNDPAYATSSGSNTITVLRRSCVVVPDNISLSVFDVFTATAVFMDVASSSTPAGKYARISFNWMAPGSTFTTTASDSSGLVYVSSAAPASSGTYKVEGFFTGDATYAPSAASTATVTVARRPSQLSLADVSTMIDRVFTATATLKNETALIGNKYVLFTFEGRNFNAKTGTGGSLGVAVATFTVTVSTGASQIDAVFNGDASYIASAASATVTAAMRPTYLAPAAATAAADKVFIATATLKDIDNNNVPFKTVSFTFDLDTSTAGTNAVGVATVAFTADVATGTYGIAVAFDGDYKYVASSTTLSLTVTRRSTSITAFSSVTVKALDVFYATATLKDMDLLTLPSKTVRSVFQGSTFTVITDGSGVAVSTWSAPASSGTYYVGYYFDGDDKYSPSTGTVLVGVQRRPVGITLDPVSTTAQDLFRTTATLADLNNGLLNVSTRTVTFSFSWGGSTSAVSDAVGVATAAYTATSTAGNYTLTGAFAGDATYASTTTTTSLPVAKRNGFVTGVYISTRVLDSFTATGTFYDSVTSATVSGRTMKFGLQNVSTLTAVTNGSGAASVNFTAPAASGTYVLSIWSDADVTYNAASVYLSSVTLVRRDSSIALTGPAASIINSSFTAGGTMYDAVSAGTVQSKTISFLFQGTTVPVVTSVSGTTSTVYTANLSSGTYELAASFAGDATYNPCVSTRSVVTLRYPTRLTAPAITAIMNEVLTATATLTDYKAGTVPAKELVFFFQGSSFTTVTNGLGVAYSTYSAAVASGAYQLPVSFAGDSLYDSTGTSISVLVNKRTPLLTASSVTVQTLNIFTATATLSDALNPALKLSGQAIAFEFTAGGTFYNSGVSDGSGIAVATFTAPASSGTYQVKATFTGNATYYPLMSTGTVTVVLRPSMLMQDNSSTIIDEVFRTTATLLDPATLQPIPSKSVKFTFGSDSSAGTGGDGKASTTFTAPSSSGAFQLNSVFEGDATYAAASSTGALTVVRRSLTPASPDISGIIDQVFTATVTLTDVLNPAYKVSGRAVSFVFNGSTFAAATDANGVAVSTFVSPSSGTFYAGITFAGDARYLPNGTTTQVLIDRRPSAITPVPVTTMANRVFTATATLTDVLNPAYKVSGRAVSFYYSFNGSTFVAATDADGVAVSTFMAPPSSGTFRLDISFAGDARYTASSSSAAGTVLRRPCALAVNPAAIKAMDVLTATATLTDTLDAGVFPSGREIKFVFLASTFTTSTDSGGAAVSTFAGPASSGAYTAYADFAGDSVYEAASASGTVTVIQRPSRLMQDNSSGVIDVLFRTTATLADLATLQPLSTKTLTFSYATLPSSSAPTDDGGQASAAFTAQSSGTYQLNSDFAGDATYAAASSTSTLTVNRRPSLIAAPDITGTIDEVFTASATLTDGLDAARVSARPVDFVFAESAFTAPTGINGVAVSTFAAPSSSGAYYAAIAFTGDARYLPSGTTAQLTVARRPSALSLEAVSVRVGDVFTATATLSDALNPSSTPLGRELVFVFAGSSFTAFTDASGVAVSTFAAPASSGTARLDVSFGGDFRYLAGASSAAVTALQRPSLISIAPALIRAMEVLTATATLSDKADPGAHASGRTLTFSFSGAGFNAVTDADGVAISTFAGPVSSGSYVVEASFAGDAIYEAGYSSGAVTVIQRPAGITVDNGQAYPFELFTASGTLRDSATGAPVQGRQVVLGLDGAYTGAVTSDLGLATAPYTPPASFGDYQVSADFAGDGTYTAAAGTGTVSVMLRPTSIAAQDAAAITLEVFTASATLSDVRFSTAVGQKDMVFTFEGQSSTVPTNAAGQAWAQFSSPVSSGTYFFTARFSGDPVYDVSSATGAVLVNTRASRVLARDSNANVGEPFTLSAQLLDPAKENLPGYYVPNAGMEFRFRDRNNQLIDSAVAWTNEIGVASVTFSGPGAPDVYYYTASFFGNYTYSASSATAMVKVGLLTSLVAFDVETVALEEFTTKAKLTDYLATTLDDKPIRFAFLGAGNSAMTGATGDSGVASSTFTAPASSGTYYYNAWFDGDSIYSASNATATLTVNLRPASLLAYPAAALAYSSFTATVVLKNTLAPYANIGGRDVNITFDGNTTTADTDLAGGVATAVFFVPYSSGAFTFHASFDGDYTYDAATGTGTLTVERRPTTMVSYDVTDLIAGSTFTALVQLKDNSNQPIPGLSVDFDFGGASGIGVTDAQGMAGTVYTAPSASGTYTYSANFYGDDRYAPNTATGTVIIGPRPTMVVTSRISARLGAPLPLSAKLVDVKTQAGIPGQTLSFYFDGSTVTAVTDSLGASSAAFTTPASTGSYYYEAAYAGDGITYLGSSSSASVTIALNLTTLNARDGISIKIYEPLTAEATLTDSIGLRLDGQPVAFAFDGLDAAGLTSQTGVATATFATMNLPSTGTYGYSANFPGDTVYVAASDTSTITILRRDTLLVARDAITPPNKLFTAQAALFDNVNGSVFMGAPVAGKPVIFELHCGTFTQVLGSTTSAQGAAAAAFTSPVSTGSYLLTARFQADDPIYENASASATVTVLYDDGTGAIKTKMTLENTRAHINHVFVASGTLTATDLPVPGKTVLFEFFNGVDTYTAAGFTDGAGLSTAAFTAPSSSGTYLITASFSGDITYSAATGTAALTADRYPDTLTAQDVSTYIGEDFTARAVLRDELTLAWVTGRTIVFEYFNGVSTLTQTAVTGSTGCAEATFAAPAVLGNYFYTASFDGDALYQGGTDKASVLIASRGSSTFLAAYDVFIGTGEVFAASATLTSRGYPVPGKPVTLKFEGVEITTTTNSQGLAAAGFTAPASSGTFFYTADFTADADYNAAQTTGTVSVVVRKEPEQPDFKADITSTTVTLSWTPVTLLQDEVAGYSIERSASLRSGWSEAAYLPSTAPVLGYSCPVAPDAPIFLKVTTRLADGQESPTSLIVEVPAAAMAAVEEPNYYYMSRQNGNAWAAWLKIPGKVMDKVSDGAPFAIEIARETRPGFLAAYNITAPGASANLTSDLKASDKKGVKLTISYPTSGFGTSAAGGSQLALFWFNGVEWVKLGGELDVLTGEIYTYSRVLGQFAVKASPLASSFTLNSVLPRVFSPDEANTTINRARFTFENPDGQEVTIRIFDITGALVRRNLESEGSNVMFWNGRNQSGAAVKGGVYIYQLEAGNKVLTGTVVVAK